MNYIVRKTLFYFFVLLFVVAAPALALYAQGYRLNLPLESGKKIIVKTGGIFLKIEPKQTDIYIDGELADQTDFFFGSSLVENLLPRQYNVEIKKTGYQTWQKDLPVEEKEVTEARNILLFPDILQFSAAEENIEEILATPDQSKIALKSLSADGWNLRLYDVAQRVTTKLADRGNFAAKDASLSGWKWAVDSNILQLTVTGDGQSAGYSIDTSKLPSKIDKIAAEAGTTATTTPELATYAVGGTDYYLADGYIYKKTASGQPELAVKAKIGDSANKPDSLRVFQNYYFVGQGGQLYVLTPGAEEFKKIFDGLAGAPEISPDGRKAVYYSNSEIWIFYLDDKNDQPAAKAGDKQFVIRLSEKISDCHWLNSDYLIFIAGQTIRTAETDTRDNVNIFNLAKIPDIAGAEPQKTPRLFWDNRNNVAYLYADKILYRSAPLN